MVVVGYGASELEDLLEEELSKEGRYVNPDPNPEKGYFYRSDHISFAKRGVPMLYADGGFDLVDGGKAAGFVIEEEYRLDAYHGVADEYSESWDLAGLNQSIDVIYAISLELANNSQWPNWYDGNEFKAIVMETGDGLDVIGENLFFPVRIALYGESKGPDIPHIFSILKRDETLSRLSQVIR